MHPRAAPDVLSKSRYISGRQCHKKLWLDAHARNLATPPNAQQEALFAAGHRVGDLAQQRWPGGVLVDIEPWKRKEAIEKTQWLMQDESVSVIYEAGIGHTGVLTRADILVRDGAAGGWSLIEVKRSTRAKDVFLNDLAVQTWILRGAGIPLARACLLLLNTEYVFDGRALDLEQLFRLVDLTDECDALAPEVTQEVARQHAVIARAEAPEIAVGDHCETPYPCPYIGHCWKDIKQPAYPLDVLPRLSSNAISRLLNSGIEDARDIPADYPLSEMQSRVRDCLVTGEPWVSPGLGDALQSVTWPLSYLDFEAAMFDIPRYAGTRPFQAIPFQFSCHVQNNPASVLQHHEYLADGHSDPRPALANALLEAVGTEGSIIVYSSYERRTIRDLAKALPDRADALLALLPRLVDLLQIIRAHYCHPGFRGSYSIKAVLPVLVPELQYGDLAIADGQAAANAWVEMIDTVNLDRRDEIAESLRRYCTMDSLAMARLRDALLAKNDNKGENHND